MSARFDNVVCTARTTRLWCVRSSFGALIGILALLMQMLPALASSEDGTWIEICSDLGPVMMQVDASGEPGEQPACPECEDCTLCAAAAPSILANSDETRIKTCEDQSAGFSVLTNTQDLPRHLRPVTRGPPQGKEKSATHPPRLSPAPTLFNGGAPWT